MEQLEESLMRFEELWFEPEIAVLCGGWIELLMDAVEEDERLILQKRGSAREMFGEWSLLVGCRRKRACGRTM